MIRNEAPFKKKNKKVKLKFFLKKLHQQSKKGFDKKKF